MPAPRLALLLAALLTVSLSTANEIIVQPQETLWTLARRHGTTVEELMQANALPDNNLRAGMTLVLPEGASPDAVDSPPAATAPAPEAAPAAAPAPAVVSSTVVADPIPTHTVQPGESLYGIATQYGMELVDLLGINGLRSDTINPGQILKVAGQSSGPHVVIIQPGESLNSIAERHGLTPRQLASANEVGLHTALNAGHPLIIPDASYVPEALADAGEGGMGGAAGPVITVQPGDNLWSLARAHGTTIEELRSMNGLDSDSLRAGQTLRLLPGNVATPGLADTTQTSSADMVWPAAGIITSRFGYRTLRIGGSNMHYGLDLDGHVGDPFYSATAGVVTFSGWRGGYGNLIIIEADSVEYYYAHASSLEVAVGTSVQAGQLIGRIGTTGNVTGAHLHFEVRVNGTPVDPLPILEARAGQR